MTESIRKKEKAVKASFKIEMTDEERKQRDSQVTNLYHTGNTESTSSSTQATSSSDAALSATTVRITMSKEDEEEL